MKVTIFGSGYVGLVTGACLAEVGNDVLCVDVDAEKIAQLSQGKLPIYEPGLEQMIEKGIRSGRLEFTTNAEQGVGHGLFQFIAVGTPPDEDGSAELKYVVNVAETIAEHMQEYRIVVNKSTVPVGTADRVNATIQDQLQARAAEFEFDVVSNPEFLKAGAAIADFMSPERIIVGTDNPRTLELLKALYAPFNRNRDRMIAMDIRSAELTKYAANAMLATKISFMNELANVAERLGADIEQVRHGIGSDSRIGYSFIYPGCGYGGSCFPKDVNALQQSAGEVGYEARLLQAVEEVNSEQKSILLKKISAHYGGDLSGKTFALWGLAFKPNTDDMREAPSRVLMEGLWDAGARVRAHDPEALAECRRIYGAREELTLCDNPDATLEGADALLVVTEWQSFRSPDFQKIKARLSAPVIFDGRNLYDPKMLRREGFSYYSIGRREVVQ
ncbi:MAG: UDP-glucose/GDP-mannose dehydrogenase family protein [Gammaproteobacteria bacterium]|nr:UDP-glucose/GDP-mannose dehydrogenase family protein [Gammaproteobacteria bacterium]